MAALSRPSLRSSSRQITAAVDDSAASGPQHNLKRPTVRPGKRVRDASSVDYDLKSFKKHKPSASVFPASNSIARSFPEPGCATSNAEEVGNGPFRAIHSSPESDLVQPDCQDSIGISAGNPSLEKRPDHVDNGRESTVAVDKRSLRSHDGSSRLKSELSLYFANYDEILGTEPKQPEYPTAETLIRFTEDPSVPSPSRSPIPQQPVPGIKSAPADPYPVMVNGSTQTIPQSEHGAQEFNGAQRLDFSSVDRHTRHNAVDFLTDEVYFRAHRRAERQEKQLRNIERERAQHEKVQLERLLDRLKGHDWLRVMGINGITDSEKKVFEPKRDYFIKEVTVLIEKFRLWKEEEKRRKAAKEQNLLSEESECETSSVSDGDPPAGSEADGGGTARKSHEEVHPAAGPRSGRRKKQPTPSVAEPLPAEKPFTSFFSKPYLRDAAIGKHRRGRTKIAFGHPIPDFAEEDFSLPADMLSQEAIAASARSRRRARRETKDF